MATPLNKDLMRESTAMVNDRNIIVTITTNQNIELKLKGMKSGVLQISLLELYDYLGGNIEPEIEEKPAKGGLKASPVKKSKDNEMLISLYDLRSMNIISMLPLNDKVKFDQIITEVIASKK